jgi:two-component system, OmpR family, alkaline phosphatase synthesis response regulator PhoP
MGSAVQILVVDDSPELLGIISQRMRERGFTVTTASDGEAALEQARVVHPDLVLLDVVMPKKSGWEVARAMRNDPALSTTKIIIMTALGEELNENASPLFGADLTLDKPFDLGQLDDAVDAMLATLPARP